MLIALRQRRESFGASLLRGERGSIYPVLAYVLSKLPQLKKRAYVARFLMPVDIPPEFLHDEVVQVRLASPASTAPPLSTLPGAALRGGGAGRPSTVSVAPVRLQGAAQGP